MSDLDTITNLSDDENASYSISEMDYDEPIMETNTTLPSSHKNHVSHLFHRMKDNSINSSASSPSSSSRRNKRKNFKPRNIHEYEGSEEEGIETCRIGQSQEFGSSRRLLTCQDEVIPLAVAFQGNERHHDAFESDNGHGDIPLDLSEVQSESKYAERKSRHTVISAEQNKLGSSHLQLPQQILHPLSHFIPMDLRLLSTQSAQSVVDPTGNEFNVNSSSCTTNYNNNYNSSHDVFSTTANATNCSSNYSSSVLSDFAQSTMKELLGLYGIAENLRQAGGTVGKASSMDIRNYDLHQLDSSRKQESSKIMFPENMARFLAAVHESVNMVNSNNALIRNSSSSSPHDISIQNHSSTSPLNFTNPSILETELIPSINGSSSEAGRSDLKSQLHLNNNNHNLSNNNNNNNISHINTRSRKRNHSPSEKVNYMETSNSQSLLLNQSNKGLKSKGPSGKAANFDLTSFPVIREGLLGKGSGPVDYTRYVKRFENSIECGYQHCRDLNYKEHFHCLQCCEGARVFIKKDEMIRHFKWHKKRDESLQHGFMRYSSSDNCADRFTECPHNRKQTHYHCIHDGCVKVYVSTSDVQMHSNYHRKDSAIIQEGFQRFRATEDCHGDHCSFRRQHTTHFHCRRDSCLYTFKNKADMEKHKAYHVKGEQMCRDGFKKFMKHEICNFSNCRFSRVCNHIHCIRDGCNYVLHSSGQLYSHKRKHERRDSELAYRRFKLAQSIMRGTIIGADLSNPSWSDSMPLKSDDENSRSSIADDDNEDTSEKLIEPCAKCDVSNDAHFHCRADSCKNAFLSDSENVSEHSRNHELEDRISSLAYFTVDPANFDAQDSTIPCVSAKCAYQNSEKHYHCLWSECSEIVLPSDVPFKRLEHFKTHELKKLDHVMERDEGDAGNANLDGFFKRKRGRPLKNRTIEVPGPNESVFTSFKLPKPIIPGNNPDNEHSDAEYKDPIGFTSYHAKSKCPDSTCPFNTSSSSHYHCAHPRCHFAVKDVHKLSLHLRDFHSNIDILDGYEYFDRSSDCRKSKCEHNGNSNHFHCVRDEYVFQRYSAMAPHEAEYHESKSNIESSSDDEEETSMDERFLKSNDTFYPQAVVGKGSNGIHPMDLSAISNVENIDHKSLSNHSLSRILQLPDSSDTQFGPDITCGRPFCKLKRKYHFHCHMCNQAFSELEKLRPHMLKHNNLSSSPDLNVEPISLLRGSAEKTELHVRKLRKDDKIVAGNSNHSSPVPSHLDLSSPIPIPTTLAHTSTLSNFLGYPTSHSPYNLFMQHNQLSSLYAGMMFGQNYSPHDLIASQMMAQSPTPKSLLLPSTSSAEALERLQSPSPLNNLVNSSSSTMTSTPLKRPSSNCSSPSSPPPSENKKQRMQLRILKDEPVPEGYVRFRFNQDCTYMHCGYREHQTHFHCTREDCGYSFCDKTRFVQHTARHDRLDSLMGGDFKQYRANVACGREDCSYVPVTPSGTNAQGQQNKASHFHCCKCDYVCTDTNKVVAHRRQHQKMDSINAAGFEKYTPSQVCNDESCIHFQKQTHYHCTKCNFSVLGLSQMSAHKYRHDDDENGDTSS